MPNQDDIAAQQALLQMHRQTLDVLLKQQAQLGEAYAPPAIVNGIRSARASIAQIKQALRDWGAQVEDLPNDAPHPSAPVDPAFRAGPGVAPVVGDTIVAHIGAGAQGIAVGKHIQQTITAGAAADLDADRRAIEALLARLERDLSNGAGQLDGAATTMAAFQLRLLAGELGKIGARATPSASTISQVGDWLADNAPPLQDALAALFTAPAVLRALRQADTPLDAWLQRRFGV
jgi:hypothetical protein